MARCYRTVSRQVAFILEGTPPSSANLLARERLRLVEDITIGKDTIRAEEHAKTITAWIALWRLNRS